MCNFFVTKHNLCMNVKRIISAVGLYAVTSGQIFANTFGLGLNGQVGMSFGGGFRTEAGSQANEEIKKKVKETNDSFETMKDVPFSGGIFWEYNFGEDNKEWIGIRSYISFARWSKANKNKDGQINEFGYSGLQGRLVLKFMFVNFDGGNCFSEIGLAARKGLFPFVKDKDGINTLVKENEEATKEYEEDYKNTFNKGEDLGITGGIGVEMMDRVFSISLNGTLWMVNQYEGDDKEKALKKADIVYVFLKNGFDLSLNIGINFWPLLF